MAEALFIMYVAYYIPSLLCRSTCSQDLGNTNYSIAVPRTQFDLRTNAELIAKAVRMLGPSATVNDRNDVIVEGYKISRSPRLPFPHVLTGSSRLRIRLQDH